MLVVSAEVGAPTGTDPAYRPSRQSNASRQRSPSAPGGAGPQAEASQIRYRLTDAHLNGRSALTLARQGGGKSSA